jgi:hypothetical protein
VRRIVAAVVHGQRFVTTHWSVVLAAANAASPRAPAALAHLCDTYWYPSTALSASPVILPTMRGI